MVRVRERCRETGLKRTIRKLIMNKSIHLNFWSDKRIFWQNHINHAGTLDIHCFFNVSHLFNSLVTDTVSTCDCTEIREGVALASCLIS